MNFRRLAARLIAVILLTCSAALHAEPKKPPSDPAATHKIPEFTIPPVKADGYYLHFMVIGDWGTGRPDQIAVAKAMADRARQQRMNFILTVGDNFYEDGVKSIHDPQWRTKFEEVYTDPALQLPIFASLGNHDHRGNIHAQMDYTNVNPRWHMAAEYYTFDNVLPDGTKIQFFAIDSDPIHEKTRGYDVQLGWLNNELMGSDAQWKIVYGHHPIYSSAEHGDDQVLFDVLKPVLEHNHADVYIAGHDHSLEMLKPVNGVNYVVAGGGGGPDMAYGIKWTNRADYAATLGGFAIFRVSRHEMVVEFVRMDGKTQYAAVINK